MNAKLICYSLGGLKPSQKVELCRELYGYKDYSNHGRYVYEREGLMQKLGFKRLLDSVILSNRKSFPQIMKTLNKYSVKSYSFNVSVRFRV
jgi:hypothetical protein